MRKRFVLVPVLSLAAFVLSTTAARRVRILLAAIALAGGSLLAVAATATPALASTPAPLTITTSTPLTATAGSAFLAKLDATGGTKPYSWSLAGGTSLPAGLVLHASTGEITGTPTGPGGTTDFIAEVTDSEATPVSATASESITVTVTPLTLTTTTLPAATAGVAYSATLAATGGVAPYSWSIPVGSLPAGLVLHAASGVISGTPKAGGNFTFTAEVTDSEALPQVSDASESITVGVAGLVVTTGSTLPTATSSVPYSVKLSAAGGITPYVWSVASGSLPAGLKLAKTTGAISGTTTATGAYSFTVQVTDSEAPAVSATENVTLYVVTPMVVPTGLPGADLSESYDQSLQPAGGLAPYTYTIAAGSLPSGLTLQSDGEITGQPTADGTSSFTISVTDSENPPATVTQAESITVTQPVIYVATDGSDTNQGSQTAPLQTIGAALTLASTFTNPVIDVAGGTYNEGAGINLITGVTINGGYDESTWTPTSSTPTTVTGSPQAALADDVSDATLNDLTLAPTTPSAPGSSVYGLVETDSGSVALTDVTILTPNATAGAAGTNGANGSMGLNGGNGGNGSSDCSTVPSGGKGGAPGGLNGGAGGGCGDAGSAGSDGPGGDAGDSGLGNGQPGVPGAPGSDGASGAYGLGGVAPYGSEGSSWVGGAGGSGTEGADGTAGGGGAGGGSLCGGFCFNITNGTGGGGGGGGGAGGGGGGGGGGSAGGGAFGIYLYQSNVTVTGSTIQVGTGGAGGNGGYGGYGVTGGAGGSGGNAYSNGTISSGGGGAGGGGGTGGQGGPGGGGSGGPSIGIFEGSSSNATVDSATFISVSAGGPGGADGDSLAPPDIAPQSGLDQAIYPS